MAETGVDSRGRINSGYKTFVGLVNDHHRMSFTKRFGVLQLMSLSIYQMAGAQCKDAGIILEWNNVRGKPVVTFWSNCLTIR